MTFDLPPSMRLVITLEILLALIPLTIWALHDLDRIIDSWKRSPVTIRAKQTIKRAGRFSGAGKVVTRAPRKQRRD